MPEPKVRFKRDDGSSYPAWKDYSISDLFTKIGNKNKDSQNTNVITNSAEFGLIPQRDYFDKDIAVEGNTGNYTIIQTGDFVYNPRKSTYAPMGPFNCYRLPEDGIVSPLYSCLRPKGILNPEYLLWYFQTDKWYEYVNDHGAQNGARHDRVGMTDKILMGIPVTAPCEEEQQKIADFLSSVDEVIAASEKEVANLETQKKAVMKKIFSQEVRFKKDDGSVFPEWEEKTLGEVCEPLQYGMNAAAGEYDGRNKYIRITDIDDSTHAYLQDSVVSPTGDLSDKYLVGKGDILLARTGASTGKSYLYDEKDGRLYFAGFLIRAHVLDGYDDYFIYSQTLTYAYDKWVKLTSQRSGQPGINAEEYSGYLLQIPCLEEQRLIAGFLSDFDEAIAAAKKELELWKELKKGLLQQMFV